MWRGTVLALKSVGGQDDPDFIDIEMQDTNDIVEFIRHYGLSVLTLLKVNFAFVHNLKEECLEDAESSRVTLGTLNQ